MEPGGEGWSPERRAERTTRLVRAADSGPLSTWADPCHLECHPFVRSRPPGLQVQPDGGNVAPALMEHSGFGVGWG